MSEHRGEHVSLEHGSVVTYDNLWLDDNAVAFDCLECGEPVYINPREQGPECIACGRIYEIMVVAHPVDEKKSFHDGDSA